MKKFLILASIILMVAAAVGWRFYVISKNDNNAGRKRSAPVVSCETAAIEAIEETFQSTGSVESPQKVELSPKVSGRIEMLEVHPGDYVTKGTVLVRLDRGELEEQVNQSRAELAAAEARLAQAKLAQVPNDVSVSSSLRQQEAAMASAEADLRQVQVSSKAAVAAAAAALENAAAERKNADVKLARVEDLYRQSFTAAQDVDDARTQAQVAAGKERSAREELRSAQAKADADVAAADAKLEQARASYEHAEANTAETSAYKQNLTALESVVKANKAALESAQTRLNNTVLVSPLNGYVTERYLDSGALAKASEPILTLQATSQLWVTVSVPGDIRERITENTPVTVAVEQSEAVPAKILRINAAADPEDRQFLVRVLLPSSEVARPGMFARVTFTVEDHQDAVAVPRGAILNDDAGSYAVVIDKDMIAHIRRIKVGFATAKKAQILEGIEPGEDVVVIGGKKLEDGQEVRIDGREESSEKGAAQVSEEMPNK
ncbi:MAG: efflux RND transporter periplasmic adaptor subunit [bacterium]|nr:efflux RND transporter periplasmic adaptor subunit [bacterium]